MTPRERLIQAAALVIRQDPKLLGIPSVRGGLINDAVSIASGSIDMPTRTAMRRRAPDGDLENVDAMMAALKRAVEAVRQERIRLVS